MVDVIDEIQLGIGQAAESRLVSIRIVQSM